MEKLIQNSDTYHIIGMCMEVHWQLRFGFSEIVYKEALEIEVGMNEFPVQREKQFEILYKGNKFRHKYLADFGMFDNIIIEIKTSKDGIVDEHVSQTLNYMKTSGCKGALIINFGKKSLEYKRLVF